MKRLLTFLCAVCLTIAVYAQRGFMFWGVDISTASVGKLDKAVKERGYSKVASNDSERFYTSTFYGSESCVLITPFANTNKIQSVSFLVYSKDFKNIVKLGDMLYEQLKKSHPDFALTETPRKGSSNWMFNIFKRGNQTVAIRIPKEANIHQEYYMNVYYTIERDTVDGF